MSQRIVIALSAMLLGAAVTPPAVAQAGDALQACATDVRTPCAGITPGQGRIAQCLKAKESKISAPCKDKLQVLRKLHSDANRSGAAPGGPVKPKSN